MSTWAIHIWFNLQWLFFSFVALLAIGTFWLPQPLVAERLLRWSLDHIHRIQGDQE